MEASSVLKQLPSCFSFRLPHQLPNSHFLSFSSFINKSHSLIINPRYSFPSLSRQNHQSVWNSSNGATKLRTTTFKKRKVRRKNTISIAKTNTTKSTDSSTTSTSTTTTTESSESGKVVIDEAKNKEEKINVKALHQYRDLLGRRDLGKTMVKWLSQGMRAMALDFASVEAEGEFFEFRQKMGLETMMNVWRPEFLESKF